MLLNKIFNGSLATKLLTVYKNIYFYLKTELAYSYKWKMKFTNIYKDCVGIAFAEIISPNCIGGTGTTVKNPEGIHKDIKLRRGESFESDWLEERQIC